MPEISRFLGIVIFIYYGEHGTPHFHANYAGQWASVSIDGLKIVAGDLPGRVQELILEWAEEHHDELIADWELARSGKPLRKIEPLI